MCERFVPCPGIIDIVWRSDDPDFYQPPCDLFDVQSQGLEEVENYLQRDKRTTEQAMFTCNLCECDLKSIVTLRTHCKGGKHFRKALQAKKDFNGKKGKDGTVSDENDKKIEALIKNIKKEEVKEEYFEYH